MLIRPRQPWRAETSPQVIVVREVPISVVSHLGASDSVRITSSRPREILVRPLDGLTDNLELLAVQDDYRSSRFRCIGGVVRSVPGICVYIGLSQRICKLKGVADLPTIPSFQLSMTLGMPFARLHLETKHSPRAEPSGRCLSTLVQRLLGWIPDLRT